eukprot:20921-Heterococcus_DN1.PRE.2
MRSTCAAAARKHMHASICTQTFGRGQFGKLCADGTLNVHCVLPTSDRRLAAECCRQHRCTRCARYA